MSFSSSKRAGFALAALLRGDRDLVEVRSAVASAEVDAVARLLEARPDRRRERVAELLDAVRPQLAALPSGIPPRMGGLLATRLPRAAGRAALAEAPAPRAGFVVGTSLTPRLLRIARHRAPGAGPC